MLRILSNFIRVYLMATFTHWHDDSLSLSVLSSLVEWNFLNLNMVPNLINSLQKNQSNSVLYRATNIIGGDKSFSWLDLYCK